MIPNTVQKRKTPQLRIIATPKCNLKCIYCRPGGEGYYKNPDFMLSGSEINTIIHFAAKVGFTHLKFTGGEPLLRKDIFEIITEAKRLRTIKEIQMVTNGTLSKGKTAKLKDVGVDCLTLSIDAINPLVFRKIRGININPVLESLHECKEVGLAVRINMVVIKKNLSQIEPMMGLCAKTGASLKLLDLIYLEGHSDFDFWEKEYVHFDVVRDLLHRWGGKQTGLEEAPGGIGAPLEEHRMPNSVQVVLKDSTRGTYYHSTCEDCKFYPCQDAIISARVTHDGHLKRCLIRNDNLVPLLPLIRKGDTEACIRAIQETFNLMSKSTYYPCKWDPEVLIEQKRNPR